MTTPAPAECLTTFALDDAPANEIFPADINNDGRLEMLCWQSPGIYQSRIFNPDSKFWDEPYGDGNRTRRTDCCLTACTADGRRLWQYGQPKRYVDGIECFTHTPDQMVWCDDLNGDGKTEVALIHGKKLLVLEGATGRVLQQTELATDNFGIVRAFNTASGKRLLVKNTERAYPDCWYGDPAAIYDANLRLVAHLPKTIGSGHSPRAMDINGDGREELLIGYEAFDADGRRLWRMSGVNADSYDPGEHHVDQLQVGRFGPEHAPGIIYAGSRVAYMADLTGRCLWRMDLGHPQHVLVGQFVPHKQHRQLAILGKLKRNVIFMLHDDGTLFNVLAPDTCWPEMPGWSKKAHSGEGMLIYPQGCADGCDAIILRDWGWPRMVDALGQDVCDLPMPLADAAPACGKPARTAEATAALLRDHMLPEAPLCPRESYGVRVCDMDGDGRAEIIIHNLRRAWIFKPPCPATAADGRAHQYLQPVSGQGFYNLQGKNP